MLCEDTCAHLLLYIFPEPPQPPSSPLPYHLVIATRSALFCLSSLHPGVTRSLLSLGGKRRKKKSR